jgi:type IV secretion system protein VirB2
MTYDAFGTYLLELHPIHSTFSSLAWALQLRISRTKPHKGEQKMSRFLTKHSKVFYLLLFVPTFFLMPKEAHAAAAWEDALQKVVDILTGNTARLLAILSVIGFGIGALFGRVSWRRAGEIVLGIAIVFGAASVVDMLTGK